MIKTLIIIFALLFQFETELSFNEIGEINFNGNIFHIDNLGAIYTVNDETLTKYSAEGNKLKSYSNSMLGSITSIDTSNPLQILILYKDFNKIILLDNTLSQIGNTIDLDNLNIDNAVVACSATNGGFWIFDEITTQLNYFDKNLRLIHKGIDISLFNKNNNMPNFIIERNNQIYLNMNGEEIFIFDSFGIYKKTINLKIKKSFQIAENKIYFFNNKNIIVHSPLFQTNDTIRIPKLDNIKDVKIGLNKTYILQENKIHIIKLD